MTAEASGTPEEAVPSPVETIQAPPVRRRRRRSHRRRRAIIRRALLVAGGIALVLALFSAWYAYSVLSDYREAKADIDAVRAMVPPEGSGERLQPAQLPELTDRLSVVDAEIRHLQDRLDVPVLSPLARRLPWIGPRVRAVDEFMEFGVSSSALARDSARLARDVYSAWKETGFYGEADPNAPTWLGVVQENRAEIDNLLARFDRVLAEREGLDQEHLPGRANHLLASLDPMLDRVERARDQYVGLLDYYPVVDQVLGGGNAQAPGAEPKDSRYIVLLLNSQEIRPSGGFPGTYAILTISQGRLKSYEFHNILELDAAYASRRQDPLPPPTPLAEYLKVTEWLPRDAAWSPDFPEAAQTLLEMYDVSGGEPLDGVIAVTDTAVQDLMGMLGPLTVEIEGESVTVNADNLIDVIESYRAGGGERHKEAVKIIGTALLDRIRDGGLDVQKQAIESVRSSADRREIQIYAIDPTVQAQVVARGWDGALVPDPAVPTLGLTLANIVGNKASKQIVVESGLDFAQQADGRIRVTWTIDLTHHGDPQGDQVYNGFHRTWVSLYLPEGSELVRSTPEPAPATVSEDPRALAYEVPLDPGASARLVVTFDLPTGTSELRLRRQAGANPVELNLSGDLGSCAFDESLSLWQDASVDLRSCTTIQPVQTDR